MKLDHHEEVFRNKLQQHRVDIDTDELWANLDEIHPKSKKRRFVVIWWLFGVATIVSLLYLSSINQAETLSDLVIEKKENTSSGSEPLLQGEKEDHGSMTNEEWEMEKSSMDMGTIGATIGATTTSDIIDGNRQKTGKSISLKRHLSVIDDQVPVVSTKRPQDNLILNVNEDPIMENRNSSKVNVHKNQTEEVLKHQTVATMDVERIGQMDKSESSVEKSTKDITKKMDFIKIKKVEHRAIAMNAPSISKYRKRSRLFLNMDFGWGDLRTTYDEPLPEDAGYINLLNSTSVGLSSQHINLGIKYEFNNSVFAQVGLSYDRLVRRLTLRNTIQLDTVVNGVQEIYYRSAGDNIVVSGPVNGVNIITQDIQWHTYRQLIDIPVHVGYKLSRGRYSASALAGISVNIGQYVSGAYVDQDGLLIKYTSGEELNPYKKNIKVSLLGGLQFAYRIYEKTDLILSIRKRWIPKTTIQYDKIINEKTSFTYASVGASIKL